MKRPAHLNMNKVIATLLSLLLAGSAASCTGNSDTTGVIASGDSSDTIITAASMQSEASESAEASFDALPEDIISPATDVTDEDSTPIVIYSWNNDFKVLLDTYYVAAHPDFQYVYKVFDRNIYQSKLDQVLAEEDGAPDIFLLDEDIAPQYVSSQTSMNINELGISNTELSDQFAYTYSYAKSEQGSIHALCLLPSPSGVFYNRTLARTYLGSDDPAFVAKSFSSWDAFTEMAAKISADSQGTVKAVSGVDDIWRSLLNNRSEPWVMDNKVTVDPGMEKVFEYVKKFQAGSLTHKTSQLSDEWEAGMANSSVLSYWGPMRLVDTFMNFGFEEDGMTILAGANPTTGDWAFCPAPVPFFWGDTWITASKYNNNKATTADIMRFFTVNPNTMGKMADDGMFVNSISVMSSASWDTSAISAYLGGQSPLPQLLKEAAKMDVSMITDRDKAINSVFISAVNAYASGRFTSLSSAKLAFITDCEDAGFV